MVAVLLVAAAQAGAASHTVLVSSNVFTPADVTIYQGDSVTWTNTGGSHNVRFDDDSFVMPTAPDASAWSVSRTFDAVGVFRYYCEAHGYPRGVDMSGAVHVQAIPSPSPSGQPVSADKTAPALSLSGSTRQRALRQRAVFVRARVNEASRVVARAWVSLPRKRRSVRAKTVSTQIPAGTTSKLGLPLSGKAIRSFRRALRKHTRLTARITVVARDAAGNRTSAKRRVKLKK